jgi:hypothetical protein
MKIPKARETRSTVRTRPMESRSQDALIKSLVRKVDSVPPVTPAGSLNRAISNAGSFEEGGVRFEPIDLLLGLEYAGLAVLARDIHDYLIQHPRDDAAIFEEVISLVHAEESKLFGDKAFPTYEGLPRDILPVGLAAAAAQSRFDISPLLAPAIVHEWTLKPGKRLFTKFAAKFKETICGVDGPYEQSKKKLFNQAALPTIIVSTVLAAGFSAATFWTPLGVYFAILLVKTGLKTYCEP